MSKKLTFSENLYIGDGIDTQKMDKLKKNLLHSPVLTKVYLITFAANPADQLDIIESRYLTYSYYNTHPLHVVGIAKSNPEAVGLVQTMVQDCLNVQGDAELKTFLMNH